MDERVHNWRRKAVQGLRPEAHLHLRVGGCGGANDGWCLGSRRETRAWELLDVKGRNCSQGEGLPPSRMLPVTIYSASFLGLAICQRFHVRRPTQLVFSPVVGAAQTFPGPTHPPSTCWECWRLMPKVALPPQGHKGPASLLTFWIPQKDICTSRLLGSAEAWGYGQ